MKTWQLLDDGTLLDPTGKPRTYLNENEQDQVILAFRIPIQTMSEIKHTAKSYSGIQLDRIIDMPGNDLILETNDCDPLIEKLLKFGGDRLVSLYCHDFNIHMSAIDLGLDYGTLSKWWLRLRARMIRDGISSKQALGLDLLAIPRSRHKSHNK